MRHLPILLIALLLAACDNMVGEQQNFFILNGACEGGYALPECDDDGDCDDGTCVEGYCIVTCDEDDDCDGGDARCIDDLCREPAECANYTVWPSNDDNGAACPHGACSDPTPPAPQPSEPNDECARNVDCGEGLSCVDGACVTPAPEPQAGFISECVRSVDCAEGLTCVDGGCRASCASDCGCVEGQICDGGFCFPEA